MKYKFKIGDIVKSKQYPTLELEIIELDKHRDYPNYRVKFEDLKFYQPETNLLKK